MATARMFSKEDISKMVLKSISYDIWTMLKKALPTTVPEHDFSKSLVHIGTNVVSSKDPNKLNQLKQFLLLNAISKGRSLIIFSRNYKSLDTFVYLENVQIYPAYSFREIKNLLTLGMRHSDNHNNPISIIFDDPSNLVFNVPNIRTLITHSGCMGYSIYIFVNQTSMMGDMCNYIRCTITDDIKELKRIPQMKKPYFYFGKEVIEEGNFFMFRNEPPIKCEFGFKKLLTYPIPYIAQIKCETIKD